MTRLVQIQNAAARRVALVDEPNLRLLTGLDSVYALAKIAAASETSLLSLIAQRVSDEKIDYEAVYQQRSPWHLSTPIDHPSEPSRCVVSGTGLTHLGGAKNRQAMHSAQASELNDSMKIFRWGVEGGKPAPGKIGVPPEWFYKGAGDILRACHQPLEVPAYAEDGGEEAEMAGLYLIDANGAPRRIGLCLGNEFSDHKFEKKNYLNLAGSKLRNCSIGPELAIEADFQTVPGVVTIERAGQELWTQTIVTGENEMCHSLANIEHHHFKFEGHRRPGDIHVHYFGACNLSFGAGVELADGDVMQVSFAGFGRPLRNPLRIHRGAQIPVVVKSLA